MAPITLTGERTREIADLLGRLEAATARLEDIASSTIELPQAVPALQQSLASPAPGPSQATTPVPKQPINPLAIKPKEEPLPESIEEFDAFLKGPLEKYAELSKSIGGLVGDQAAEVVKGFKEQRKFLLLTTKAKKPDLSGPEIRVYQDLVKPINETIMAVTKIKDDNRGSPFFSQLSAVSEGIMVLAWVNIENRPYKHVDESLGSAQFFGNRVLKEQKDKDPQQIEWVRAFYGIFRELSDYVKQHFNNGIPWNPKGLPAAEAVKSLSSTGSSAPPPSAPALGGGGPPPPPPPGPPPILQIKEQGAPAPSNSTGLGAVFSELNQGEAVTKGLKKVDKSQMTHKNPALRASSTVPGSGSESSGRGKSPVPGKKPKPESMRVKKPPKKELDGNKWTIVSDSISDMYSRSRD
jgi:adenylyl cyclase-associated protein